MAAFRRILFTAALAGLLSGLALTAVQTLRVIPLILQAESYERAASPGGPRPPAQTPWADPGRLALTALANALAATGFGLALAAGFSLTGGASARVGVLWGLAGFAAFSLAPALGLPPELPGAQAAPLGQRQLWWLLTAAATAGGLGLLAFTEGIAWKLLAPALLALPHLIGAPHPAQPGGAAPAALQRAFAAASLLSSALLWLLLGGLSGFFYQRLGRA
ncbi:MAG: CbtA family protein [Nitrospinota bacterium]